MCLEEIGLHAQNILNIRNILGSVLNKIRGPTWQLNEYKKSSL